MTASSLTPPVPSATRAAPDARGRPRPDGIAQTIGLALRISLLTFAAVLIVAVMVRLALAGQARRWLAYSFPGIAPRADVAVAIFAHNARAMLGVFGLLLIAQLAARRPVGRARAQRSILAGGEVILAGVIAANVLIVGAGLGGYGQRIVRADLPHGPVELAAYALALTLYLQGRQRALSAAHLAKVILASVALLALAATLETFVNL
jgi:hypothetical protein